MSALSHRIGEDLSLDDNGGLLLVSGAEQVRQALLRRLCTNQGELLWHGDYGAGLPALVGDPVGRDDIETIIAEQLERQDGVDVSQPHDVSVSSLENGRYLCTIRYVDADTQEDQAITIAG